MSRFYFFVLLIITCLFAPVSLQAKDSLQSGFTNPPNSAKARTWWHWINGNVSKEGITADLEAMKRVGIQEAQIFNVDQGFPEGQATFMSPKWLDLFRFAVSEAKRLGLEIGFHNGAGWSSSGGPWITPKYAMQTVVYSEVKVKGGEKINQKLPQPPTKFNYYKDIAVLAFPTPKGNERIDNLDIKTLSTSFQNHLEPDIKPISETSLIHKSDILNLSSKLAADGTLDWDAPAGDWTILRIGHTPNGTENRPAGIGGRGLECDKMSRKAVEVYWAGGIEPILNKLGSLVGPYLTNCLVDSYEVGCNNWTTGLDKNFLRLRSYDCMAFLPTLAGYYIESGEISERFLWDFRRTIGDMMAENYYTYFGELCHKNGMKFSVEPYGGPFDNMQVGATGDIVMSEFWLGETVFPYTHKLVSSIAHLKGNAVVGAESFTSRGGWRNHPATLKQTGDRIWSEGVNRFIFHTYTHQPWNIAPGMTFHMYGLDNNRLNTWWEQGKAYMSYLAKSQFLLQQGRCAADVLVFAGESSPNDGIFHPEIKALGYDYDLIGTNNLSFLTVKNGWICTPVGGKYRVLMLPQTNWMSPELLQKIHELIKAGALIIGPKPVKSPSLQGFPGCDDKVELLASGLWVKSPNDGTADKNHILDNVSIKDVLESIGLAPDFSGGATGSDLNFIHRVTDNADIYFVANPMKESRNEMCSFRVSGKQPEIWNAEKGEIKDAAVWQANGDVTNVRIPFDSEGAVFVVFRKSIDRPVDPIVQTKVELIPMEIKPLLDLKIINAEYGSFLPVGLVDVTKVLAGRIKNGKLQTTADNGLSSSDPAQGTQKELRVEYETGGQLRKLQVYENAPLIIDTNEEGGLKLIRAVYGKFEQGSEGLPPVSSVTNLTSQISDLVASKIYVFPVNDQLLGEKISTQNKNKELRLTYSSEGEMHQIIVAQGRNVDLSISNPESKLMIEDGEAIWITPQAGTITCFTASGAIRIAQVDSIPKPIEMVGPWDVSFPPNLGAPSKAKFDKLISWPTSSEEGIRYFSGTATYRKQFALTKDLMKAGRSLELDLGSVRVIAEVIVNGKNLGILWRAPYRINIGDAVRAGANELEVRITNLWPNRLIGDAHLPEDCNWGDWSLKSWPDWLTNKANRSSRRVTFTTWKHWDANSPLQPSGLLGPVILRPYMHVKVGVKWLPY